VATSATIPRVIRTAMGLLVVAVSLGGVFAGVGFAQSVLAGGLAMLASFGASVWLSRRVTAAVEQGFSTGASGLILVKLPVLVIVLWGLFERFDVLGVVLGGCVMVSAVVIDAVRIGDKSMVGAT
jgi:hypothetical protein